MLGFAPVVGVPAVAAGLTNKSSSAQEVFKKWSEPEPERPWAHSSNLPLVIVAGQEVDASFVEMQLPKLPQGSRPVAFALIGPEGIERGFAANSGIWAARPCGVAHIEISQVGYPACRKFDLFQYIPMYPWRKRWVVFSHAEGVKS
jgi:hypothetical protein